MLAPCYSSIWACHTEHDIRAFIPSWLWDRGEGKMEIVARALKCVVFIGVRDPTYGTFTPLGTGFLVTKDEGGIRFQHIVTARHVIDQIALDHIWVRVNKIGGGSELLPTEKCHWYLVDGGKEFIDVAIMPCVLSPSVFDVLHLDCGSDAVMPNADPGPETQVGDQICVIGLFTSHFGAERNVPVARFGNVAAVPDDPILTEYGYMSGYLVELKSLGGMSGSPVIVSKNNFVAASAVNADPEPEAFLAGIMHGHFIIENPEDAIQADPGKSTGQINTGIGVVIPAKHILTALELPPVAEGRKIMVERLRKKSGVKADTAGFTPPAGASGSSNDVPPANGENPTHREDFRRLVGAAARKPPQEG